MLLGHMINMLVANRYVIFEDGQKIGEYENLEEASNYIKNSYVMEIMSPLSTKFHNADGDMFITVKLPF